VHAELQKNTEGTWAINVTMDTRFSSWPVGFCWNIPSVSR